jgi:SAM-dependent methyltransferase
VGGRAEFFWCEVCGTVQPAVSDAWRAEAATIYEAYQTYAAAGGAEQMSVGQTAEGFSRRSDLIVAGLERSGVMGEVRSILDVGCGRGAFLSAFARRFPGTVLHGYEIDEKNRADVESLSGGVFHTGDMRGLKTEADVISLIHVLEHIENPAEFLRDLKRCGSEGGSLVVQVPAWTANPFALMIRDHASHFTASTLRHVVEMGGWTSLAGPDAWVAKELSLVAGRYPATAKPPPPAEDMVETLRASVAWLQHVTDEAGRVARSSARFGLFGTAIAATWLSTQLPGRVGFFVDEDPARIGGTHLGLPIVSLTDVEVGADVFVPIAPVVSAAIRPRLEAECPGRLFFPSA